MPVREGDSLVPLDVHTVIRVTRFAFYCEFTVNHRGRDVRARAWLPRAEVRDEFLYHEGQEDARFEISELMAKNLGLIP